MQNAHGLSGLGSSYLFNPHSVMAVQIPFPSDDAPDRDRLVLGTRDARLQWPWAQVEAMATTSKRGRGEMGWYGRGCMNLQSLG